MQLQPILADLVARRYRLGGIALSLRLGPGPLAIIHLRRQPTEELTQPVGRGRLRLPAVLAELQHLVAELGEQGDERLAVAREHPLSLREVVALWRARLPARLARPPGSAARARRIRPRAPRARAGARPARARASRAPWG